MRYFFFNNLKRFFFLFTITFSFLTTQSTFADVTYTADNSITVLQYTFDMLSGDGYRLVLQTPTNILDSDNFYFFYQGTYNKMSTFCNSLYGKLSYEGNYRLICTKQGDSFYNEGDLIYNGPTEASNYTPVTGYSIMHYDTDGPDMFNNYGLLIQADSLSNFNKDVYVKQGTNYYKLDTDFCTGNAPSGGYNEGAEAYTKSCSKDTDFFKYKDAGNLYFYTPATCSDGIQNQDETAIDKGGACNLLAPTMPNVASQNGTKSTVFSHSYKATDSDSPDADMSYSVVSGTLPNGTSLNTSNGTISGTPTTAGTFTFTIGVTDSVHTDSKEYSIVIADSDNDTGVGTTLSSTSGVTPVQLIADIFEGSDTLLNIFGTPVNTDAQTKIAEYETFIKNSTTHRKIRGCSSICFISNQ